jgi:hypothetical protein
MIGTQIAIEWSGKLEHFHFWCDVVRFAMCGHSFIHPSTQGPRAGDPDFTPAHKDRAPEIPIQWNGRAWFSISAYTNSENAPTERNGP